MRKLITPLLPAAAILLGTVTPLQSHAQPYSRQYLQDLYAAHLRSEAMTADVASSGHVRFRRDGRNYIIEVDEKDPLYFRLTLAFVVEDKSDAARARQLEACNATTAGIKVVKCFLDDEGDLTLAAEMFLIVPGDFKASLPRLLNALDRAHGRYTRTLAELR